MAFEEQLDLSSPIHEIRTSSLKQFEALGFPTKKDEAWKYTSLAKLLKNDYSIFPKKETTTELKDVKKKIQELERGTREENINADQLLDIQKKIRTLDRKKAKLRREIFDVEDAINSARTTNHAK